MNLSSQMPRSPTVPQPRRSTLVDFDDDEPRAAGGEFAGIHQVPVGRKALDRPNIDASAAPRCGSSTSTPRIVIGENSSGLDMAFPGLAFGFVWRRMPSFRGPHSEANDSRDACRGKSGSLHGGHDFRSTIAAMTPPSLSPGSADVLLFDLGRVVLDIDFDQVMARLGRLMPAASRPSLPARFVVNDNFRHHETGQIDDAAFFAESAATRSASAFRTPSSWRDGTRSSPARCRASRRCWRAPRRSCRSMPSPTPTRRMSSISRRPMPTCSAISAKYICRPRSGCGSRTLAAYDHVVKAIGVPASRIVFFDDSADNIAGARAYGLTAVHVKSPEDVAEALAALGI